MVQPDESVIRYVATPQDLDELCELMATAHQREMIVLPRGSGSKLSWLDLPAVVDVVVDMTGFASWRFDEDSATITAGAGIPVAVVQDELARFGRRLPLDPPSVRATLGGAVVTAETGPLAHLFGPPAAHIADATVILPDGTLSHIADRVSLLGASVFDLRWAYPGWPNAACAVAEVTLHTQPAPEAQVWLSCPVSEPMHVAELLDQIRQAAIAPAAIELDLPGIRMGAAIPPPRDAAGVLAILLEGSEAGVLDRRRTFESTAGPRAYVSHQMPEWWGRYPFRAGEIALRLNAPDGLLHVVCYALADAVGAPVPVRGSLGAGPGWATLPGDLPPRQLVAILDAVREVLLARGGSAVVQAAPRQLKEVLVPYRQP